MDSKSFKEALTDLYNIYNTSKIKEVERIVSTYNGREYDALKTVILKYNFKGHPSYNENANRDEYVSYIINSYSNGDRVLSKENIRKQSEEEELKKIREAEQEAELKKQEKESIVKLGEEVKDEIKKEIEELSSKLNLVIESKTKEISDFFAKKNLEFEEKSNLIKGIQTDVLNSTGQTVVNEVVKDNSPHTKVNIESLNFTDADIKLPSQDVIENLHKGAKLIVETSEGRVCGIQVQDITYDMVSHPGEIVKEIILQKI
jgi:hypothetical protein